MDVEYIRDRAMSALILGFFAACWFGWAQERPPASWRPALMAGGALSLVVAVAGGLVAWRQWAGDSAFDQPGAMRRYGIVVGLEFGIAAAGAAALAFWRRPEYVAPWICLVVGVHFWPLAPVLRDPTLIVLGALMAVIAVLAVLAGRRSDVAPSAVAGAGAGLALLGYAAWGMVAAVT